MGKKGSYRRKAPTSARSFRRSKTESAAPGASILVVTEGVNTEEAYMDLIRERFAAPTVELVPHGEGKGDPRVLTDAALAIREKRRNTPKEQLGINRLEDFDEIWIVFDTDVLTPDKRNDGIAYAKRMGVNIAPTEPCFEFWLLLHGKYTTAPMAKCNDVIRHLKSTFGWKTYSRDGKKADKVRGMLQPLVEKPRLKQAVSYAKKVRAHHTAAASTYPANPCSEMDQLIEAINTAVGPANKFL